MFLGKQGTTSGIAVLGMFSNQVSRVKNGGGGPIGSIFRFLWCEDSEQCNISWLAEVLAILQVTLANIYEPGPAHSGTCM